MADEAPKFTLTPERETFLRLQWSRMSIEELARETFGDKTLAANSPECDFVKLWIINESPKAKMLREEKNKIKELSEEQKEFINNHMDAGMSAFEITKLLFPNKKISPLNREFLLVQQHIKKFSPESIPKNEAIADGEYESPQSIFRLIPKVNKYIGHFNIEGSKPLDAKSLSDRDIKNLKSMLINMNTHNFLAAINLYERESERELFESKFIRFTYDKPDLLQEEVDQYVAVCDKTVALFQLKQQIQTLQRRINLNFITDDDKKQKLATNDINLLESYRERETASEKWVENVLGTLVGSRNARLKGKVAENASVLNLVEAFQGEKKRQELAELFEKHKLAEQKAVDNLSSMDAVIALVAGYSSDDAKYG